MLRLCRKQLDFFFFTGNARLNESTDVFIHTYFYQVYMYDMLSTLHSIKISMQILKLNKQKYMNKLIN